MNTHLIIGVIIFEEVGWDCSPVEAFKWKEFLAPFLVQRGGK